MNNKKKKIIDMLTTKVNFVLEVNISLINSNIIFKTDSISNLSKLFRKAY